MKKSPSFVNFMIGLSRCTIYSSNCTNEINITSADNAESIQYIWIEGEYNFANPSKPINYVLRKGQEIHWDTPSADYVYMNWQIHQVYDIDGRIKTFYKMRDDVDYYYAWYAGIDLPHIVTFFMGVEQDITRYTQYYQLKPSGSGTRNLASINVTENITSKSTVKEITESMIFYPLFVLSQLGGLYAILVLICGLIISPIVHKLFLRDNLHKMYLIEKKRLRKLFGKESREARKLEDVNVNNLDVIINSL
jgi:hypothetical protein